MVIVEALNLTLTCSEFVLKRQQKYNNQLIRKEIVLSYDLRYREIIKAFLKKKLQFLYAVNIIVICYPCFHGQSIYLKE